MTTQAPSTDLPTDNQITQEQRARLLREERSINTRAAMHSLLDPSAGGRFAKEVKADFTVGRDEAVHYPRLPSGPWGSGPQVGVEPPLGFSVNDLEPTGELHELQHCAATDNLLGGSCADAGYSSPAVVDPPALPGINNSAASPDAASVATDAPGEAAFSLGSSDPFLLLSKDQQLAGPSSPPPATTAGPPLSKSWRRFG
jgi:hypothetical protein